MKKVRFMLLAIVVLFSPGCSCAVTTTTNNPENHLYSLNETINIIDIESRASLGTVTITGIEILKSEPFTVRETGRLDSDGNTTYTEITYSKIIQIYYTYTVIDSSKRIRSTNFDTFDTRGERGSIANSLNPRPNFTEIPRDGNHSFTVALRNQGNYIYINFNYNTFQSRPTARIRIDLNNINNINDNLNNADNDDNSNNNEIVDNDSNNDNNLAHYIGIGILGIVFGSVVTYFIVKKRYQLT